MEIGNKPIKIHAKLKIITAISSGVLFAAALLFMDVLIDGEIKSIYKYLFQGVFFGVFMGIGFPYLMQKFGSKFNRKNAITIQPELSPNEVVEIEGPANLFRGIEAVGGKLFLTNENIIFKSHKLNIQRGQTIFLMILSLK